MAHVYDSWESYFYPETIRVDEHGGRQGTLRNLFDYRDAGLLADVEYTAAVLGERALRTGAVTVRQTFDAAHIKEIHRHLLGDVYEWAGEYRAVNLTKGKGGFAHFELGHIDAHLQLASTVVAHTDWPTLQHGQFAQRIAEVFAHVNQAHPFREGNGRATKLFLHDVAQRSPFRLDFGRVDPDAWNARADASRPRDALSGTTYPHEIAPLFESIATRRPAGEQADDLAIEGAMARLIRQHYPEPGRSSLPPEGRPAPAARRYGDGPGRDAGGVER